MYLRGKMVSSVPHFPDKHHFTITLLLVAQIFGQLCLLAINAGRQFSATPEARTTEATRSVTYQHFAIENHEPAPAVPDKRRNRRNCTRGFII